jgi:hypothetical protein
MSEQPRVGEPDQRGFDRCLFAESAGDKFRQVGQRLLNQASNEVWSGRRRTGAVADGYQADTDGIVVMWA